jgi:hypothetical protein
MQNDTGFFNMAFIAYAEKTGFDGRFFDLPMSDMCEILADAQFLKGCDARPMSSWSSEEFNRYARLTGQQGGR